MSPQVAAATITAAAVVLGLVVQGLVARSTLRQKEASDRRQAQWERIQWAVDKTLSDDPEALEIGMRALEALALDDTVGEVDLEVVGTALDIGDPKLRDVLAADRQAAADPSGPAGDSDPAL